MKSLTDAKQMLYKIRADLYAVIKDIEKREAKENELSKDKR